VYNNTSPRANANNLDELADQAEHFLMTEMEIPLASDMWNSYATMKGFFVPPVDGQYQFRIGGDDGAWLYMSLPESRRVLQDGGAANTTDNNSTASTDPVVPHVPNYAPEEFTIDPANLRTLTARVGHSGYRSYTGTSEWIDMKGGQKYFMEGRHS